MSDEELTKLFEGYGWHPLIVAGDDDLDAEMAAALDTAYARDPRAPGARARGGEQPGAAALADDRAALAQGLDRSQGGRRGRRSRAPRRRTRCRRCRRRRTPSHLKILEDWLRSYGPEELFDDERRPRRRRSLAACPTGDLRMGANPHVNGGNLRKAARAPRPERARARRPERPGADEGSALMPLGELLRGRLPPERRTSATSGSSVPTRWRRTASARCSRSTDHAWRVAARPGDRHGPRARRADHGGPLRAQLPGLAAGLRPDRPPRRVPLLRGVHPDRRRDGQPVRRSS